MTENKRMRVLGISQQDDSAVIHFEGTVSAIVLVPRGGTERFDVPFTYVDNEVRISLSTLTDALPKKVARYDLRFIRDQSEGSGELVSVVGSRNMNYWQRFLRDSRAATVTTAHLYVNLSGNLSVVVRSPTTIDHVERNFRSEHEIWHLKIGRDQIRFEFSLKPLERGEFSVERCYMRLDSEYELVELPGVFDVRKLQERFQVRATVTIPRGTDLRPLHYSLYAELVERESGSRVNVRIGHLSRPLYERLHSSRQARSVTLRDKRVFVPATSLVTTVLGFVVRDASAYDTQRIRQQVLGLAARAIGVGSRLLRIAGMPTALLFEKEAQTAQDNAFALLQHLETRQTEVPFRYYFVMDSRSPQWDRVSGNPAVLRKYSFKFWRLLASSSTFLLASEVRFHLANVYAQPDRLNKILSARRHYFLQHGVLGLKKVVMYNPASAMFPDATVASSGWEKQILLDSGVADSAIDITGLPRWDRLQTESSPGHPISRVLYMPTWRSWLEGENSRELSESQFVSEVRSFLSSDTLNRILEQQNCELHFVPHPKMASALGAVETGMYGERIFIVNQNTVDFGTLVRDSDLLITDYSSLLWDFVQSRKSVVLFQFDQERYQSTTGSYANETLERVLEMVPTVTDGVELLSELERMLSESIESREHHVETLQMTAFPYSNEGNAERVIEAVSRRLGELTVPAAVPGYEEADKIYRARLARLQATIDKWVDSPTA